MATTVSHVDGMSCMHCVTAFVKAATALGGVNAVPVDLQGKVITVNHEIAWVTFAQRKEAMAEHGCDAVI